MGTGTQEQHTDVTRATATVNHTFSFFTYAGVSCLLPESIKLWQANLLACKVKISEPLQFTGKDMENIPIP